MTDIYVDDAATGSGTGADWTNAYTTCAAADTVDAAGDTLFVANTHTEEFVGNLTLTFAGTVASPSKLVSTAASGAPPTAITKGAQINNITTTGNLTITGSVYVEGMVLAAGVGANNTAVVIGQSSSGYSAQFYKNCDLKMTATGASASITLGASGDTAGVRQVTLEDTDVYFSAAGQGLGLYSADIWWKGGAGVSGTTLVNNLFRAIGGSNRSVGPAIIEGVDLSTIITSSGNIAVPPTTGQLDLIVANCKMPDSWTGGIFSTVPACPGIRGFLHNCDSADTNYRFQQEEYAGDVYSDTGTYRSGGSSDGTTSYSFRMETSANAEYPLIPLILELPAVWVGTVGSSKTVTVHIIHDTNTAAGQGSGTSYAFTNAEIWLEVEYLSDSTRPIASFINDAPASCIAAAADQASSSETWTNSMTTPVKQKLEVTFTPQQVGYFKPRVYFAAASKTCYVDGDAVES